MAIMKPQQLYFKGREKKNRKKGKKMQKYLERCDKKHGIKLMELAQEPAHTQTGF
jgi:hypothetical protein